MSVAPFSRSSFTTPELGGDRGVYWHAAGTVRLVLERVRQKGLDAHAELVAYDGDQEYVRMVVNLLSPRTRAADVKHLRERIGGDEIPWDKWLDNLFRYALQQERQGVAPVEIANLDEPTSFDEPVFIVRGVTLMQRHQTTIYGPQGSAKTWFQIAGAIDLVHQGEVVAILDYELTEDAWKRRAWLVAGGRPPVSIHYFAMTRPLVQDEDRLRRMFSDLGVTYVFIDSQGPAIDGPLSDDVGATEFRNALARLNVGACVLAHVTKSVAENPLAAPPAGPIGSVFLGNLSRLNWFARREPPDGSGTIRVGLTCMKNTFGPDLPPVGLEVRFKRDGARTLSVSVSAANAFTVAVPPAAMPIWKQMQNELTAGPKRPIDLAQALKVEVDTISRTARAHRDVFDVKPGTRGEQGTIGLLTCHDEDGHE